MANTVLGMLRRMVGLHGDAVTNAAEAVHDDTRARRHRQSVQAEVRDIVADDAEEKTPAPGGAPARESS